ncbi:MAG: hypothetical protein EB127_14450 [Alphaproteobacteria bacterium]|nr:hypothetical protein [Alphaproteobacteria bacterium]
MAFYHSNTYLNGVSLHYWGYSEFDAELGNQHISENQLELIRLFDSELRISQEYTERGNIGKTFEQNSDFDYHF